MKTRNAVVKVGKGDEARIVWEGPYTYPETWAEADEMDGHDKAFKTYLTERYTNFLDARRREAVSNAIPKPLKDKIRDVWRSGDAEKIKKLADLLTQRAGANILSVAKKLH